MIDDNILEVKIRDLQTKIISWAQSNNIWDGSCFYSYSEYFDDEPSETDACVIVLALDGHFFQMFNILYDQYTDEFDDIVDETDFRYEQESSHVLLFYCKDECLNKLYLDYFEWKWISELVKPDYTSLYDEFYDYFHKNPDKLYSLEPRKVEILISEVFKNQGYQTVLGPGTNDGGVDLRLYQKDEIDQIVTLVQIKRYKKEIPIDLKSVAFLSALVEEEKANRGLFITTSRYLPQSKSFAARQKNRLILADSINVSEWCENVKTRIVRDKSKILNSEYILRLLKHKDGMLGQVVVASLGGNCMKNQFCLIVKDSPFVSLLMKIPGKAVKHHDPPYNFRGNEVPILEEDIILKCLKKENIFRAKKDISSDKIHFWGDKNLFSIWDGKPVYFDILD